MKITNRLFTYPVLSDEKDDYKNSVFDVEFKHAMQGVNILKLSFDINMNCKELERLILDGKAEYVIHLECSLTAFRKVLRSVSEYIDYSIPIGRINGSLEAVAFIILKKNISDFTCADWIDDFDNIKFHLSAGSILAYQNLQSLNVTKDYEEFINAESIISVYKRITEDDRPAEISLDSSKIRIGLGTKDYETYSGYARKTELQPILNAILVLPALVYVFEELKQTDGEEIYHNKEWFIALERAYAKRGIALMEEVRNAEKTSFQLAQEAMELPLSRALNQLHLLYDTEAEEA